MLRVLKKREQFFLYVIFALICSSLVFNFIAYPLWQKNQSLNSEITRTRLKLIKYQEVLNRKDRLENNYSESSPALRVLEQKQDTVVAVLAELELLSQQANVKILDIRPQSITRASGAREASFDLRLEGDIEGYLKFIYEIENSVFLLRIKKILLHAKVDSESIEGAFTILQTSRN
jgi:hypothetical protein